MPDRMMTEEELSALNDRISANADGLILRHSEITTRHRRQSSKNIDNVLRNDIATITNHCVVNELKYPGWLDDLVTAASRMHYGSTPLNRGNILKVLSSLDVISSESIAWRLNVGERMAQSYLSCIRVIYPKLGPYVKAEMRLIEDEHTF